MQENESRGFGNTVGEGGERPFLRPPRAVCSRPNGVVTVTVVVRVSPEHQVWPDREKELFGSRIGEAVKIAFVGRVTLTLGQGVTHSSLANCLIWSVEGEVLDEDRVRVVARVNYIATRLRNGLEVVLAGLQSEFTAQALEALGKQLQLLLGTPAEAATVAA